MRHARPMVRAASQVTSVLLKGDDDENDDDDDDDGDGDDENDDGKDDDGKDDGKAMSAAVGGCDGGVTARSRCPPNAKPPWTESAVSLPPPIVVACLFPPSLSPPLSPPV